MIEVIFYLSPIIASIFFATCISIAKRIKNGQDVSTQTFIGSIMFGFLFLAIIWTLIGLL
jgi:hypothetical protein